MLFYFHLLKKGMLFCCNRYINEEDKEDEKWSVNDVARTQGSYTFLVASLNKCLKIDS
jgi:hypothetical protein